MKNGKKKRGISLFAAAALVLVLAVGVRDWKGEKNPLLDTGMAQTLYAQCGVGQEPLLDAASYFEEGEVDAAKVTYDMSGCDLDEPGVYQIPVFYDGQETNCVFELTVMGEEPRLPDGSGDRSGQEIRAAH